MECCVAMEGLLLEGIVMECCVDMEGLLMESVVMECCVLSISAGCNTTSIACGLVPLYTG